MKVLFATKNKMKFELMKKRLESINDIELVSPDMLGIDIKVDENGNTAEENAIIKARAYNQASNMPTIAEDSGLFIDKFRESEQPGLFVKRVNGREDLTDEQVLNYYIDKLSKYDNRSLAHYYTGVCVINGDKEYSDTIDEEEFLLTTTRCKKVPMQGGVLDCISYDLDAMKYFPERNTEEEKVHYKELDTKYCDIVKKQLLAK